MAKYCSNCGREIDDAIAFCPECGTRAPTDEAVLHDTRSQTEQPAPTEAKACADCGARIADGAEFCPVCGTRAPTDEGARPDLQPSYTPPVYAPAPEGNDGVVGIGYYIGMIFLYSLPVIGWIACLITSFTGGNKSKKNFARAMLIWYIIGIIVSIIAFVTLIAVGEIMFDYIKHEFGSVENFLNQFNHF